MQKMKLFQGHICPKNMDPANKMKRKSKSQTKVSAILNRVKIYGSMSDFIHGHGIDTYEIFVPKMGFGFNTFDGQLHIVTDIVNRYNGTTFIRKVNISYKDAKALSQLAKTQNYLHETAKRILSECLDQ